MVPLSPRCWKRSASIWRWLTPKPATYLFPGTVNGSRADKPITRQGLLEGLP